MDKPCPKLRFIADFNVSNLAGYLRKELIGTNVEIAPYGQVISHLLDDNGDAWQQHSHAAIVWTRPESLFQPFQELLAGRSISIENILAEVDQYALHLLSLARRVKVVLTPAWLLPAHQRGLGMMDLKLRHGLSRVLMQMNLRLAEQLESAPNVFLLDAQKWVHSSGRNAFNPKLWYMAKIPFSNEVFKEATSDIIACLDGLAGRAKKLILLDLDETLWGGVVGDVGWQQIRVGGHDFIGEAYADFQRALKALKNRGVLLGIVSKNDEATALTAIRSHPEMILRPEDFAGWKINRNDKAQNVLELVQELNLGLDAAVFIDDNPVERARIQEAIPEVHVPDWPADCLLYTSALHALRCFDAPALSAEDLQRTAMYASEKRRSELKREIINLDEWLKSLEVTVIAEELNPANLERAAQLFNKTNQMNLSTRRLSAAELTAWADGHPGRRFWTFRVSDRFGDSGLTGIASVECNNGTARIVDFLLSCRVMGRRVEEAMLHFMVGQALTLGATVVEAGYLATAKNQPCLEFWKRSGLDQHGDRFIWSEKGPFPAPQHVRILSEELPRP